MTTPTRGAARAPSANAAMGTPRACAVRCAEFIVDASEALDSVIGSRHERQGQVESNILRARECMRALAAVVAMMLRKEDEGEAGAGEDARRASVETRRLARKCEALERAVEKLRRDNVELEREVVEGRSAWFDEARRELDAALRRGAKSAASTSASAREKELERRCAMLQTQNNELRSEAVALEEDVVRAERVASRLQKENAVLLHATKAAKEEFKRLERFGKDTHRSGSDRDAVAALQRKVESMAGTIGDLSRMNAHLARDASTSRPSAPPADKKWVSEEARQASATAAAAATVFSAMANLKEVEAEEEKRQSTPSSPMRWLNEIERGMASTHLKSPDKNVASPRLPAYLGSPFGNSVASIARSPLR